jgi:hemerythrin-like metal-binding protein
MASITNWSADLSVGNYKIDEQRKELLESGQRALDLIDRGNQILDAWMLYDVCDKILQLALQIFAEEENLLTWNRCPSLAAHQEQHNSCLKAIAVIRANATRQQADKQSMITLLSEYLRNHMLVTDLSCKEYMRVNLGNA